MNATLNSPSFNRRFSAAQCHDVAVVGGGLVGAAFALSCAQAGLDVALIAAAPASLPDINNEPWDRRVYAINPASRRYLEDLKLWRQLDPQRLTAVHDMRVFGASSETKTNDAVSLAAANAPAALHFSAYQAGTEALAWIVEHRELARVLHLALDFQQGVRRISAQAENFVWHEDRVAISGSLDQPAATLAARLVVGADGAHSKVRAALGIKTTSKPYEQTGVVANFSCAKAHGGTAYQWFTSQGVVALLPLPGQAVALVWSAPTALAQELLRLSPEALAQRVEAMSDAALGTLQPLSTALGFPLEHLTTTSVIGSRAALIGDAAHVIHPLAGQGLNLGLQDAETLTRILREREVFRDCGDQRLLRRYARARCGPIAAMGHVTDGLQTLFALDDPLVRVARNFGMNLIDRVPVLKKRLIRGAMG